MQNGPDFDKLIEPFIEIYQNVELDIIKHIASHFKLYEPIGFKNSMEWYAKKVEELGGLTQEAINIISKETKIPKKKIIRMLKEVGLSVIDSESIDKLNDSRDFKIDINKLKSSESFLNIVENSYKEIDGIFKLINTKAIEGANQAYMDVLNKTYISVKSGSFDYNTAIRKALTEMATKGIKVASYKQKNGKVINYSIESCVRRDVLTAVVQCTNKASENFAKEMKAEYYEVSQHLGARDTGTHDYKDHSWWQGKILKIDGSTKEYPNFKETCNEGDIQGIGGANCRHIKWPFWLGISVPKTVKISPEENKRLYELSQTQRRYERTIRDYKRNIEVAKASDDKEKYDLYKDKLQKIDKEYNQFCKDNNLKRKFTREEILNQNYNSTFFEDEYFKEFENLDKSKEHLIYYDLESGDMLGSVIHGKSNQVKPSFSMKIKLLKAKPNSLITVHNHPSNSSFSLTDFKTFNNSVELKGIAVRTDEFIYLLDAGKGAKLDFTEENMKYMENKFHEIEHSMNFSKQQKTVQLVHERNKKFAKEMGWRYGRIKNNSDD